MDEALCLAWRALGNVWPNPAVGCVLVKDGRVVGRGWTRPGGRPHAESEAIERAGEAARGQHGLRDARALRPSRPHAALHRGPDRRRHRPRRGRRRRPRPARRRQGHRAPARGRHRGRGRLPRGRGLPAHGRLLPAHAPAAGRSVALKLATSADGRIATADRRQPMDHRRGRARRGAPAAAAPRRHPGRQRHGAGRRPPAHLPPARAGGPLAGAGGARPPAARCRRPAGSPRSAARQPIWLFTGDGRRRPG